MKFNIKQTVCTGLCAAAICSFNAQAIDLLQLDIGGGTYETSDETVYASGSPFTLYALVNSLAPGYSAGTTYYISMAIVPKLASLPAPPNIGSFSFGGTTYAGSDLLYGIPPVADPVSNPAGNLAAHGIFETWYKEVSFTALPGTSTLYNSQDNPGGPPEPTSGPLFYNSFAVDVSGLNANYGLHFDLYTVGTDNRILQFAAFSHDAQSGPPGGEIPGVPDGGTTAMLIGLALSSLAVLRRYFS